MQSNIIFVAQSDGDAALGILRSGFAEFALGQHQHASGFRELDSGAQTGNPGSYNDEVCFLGGGFHGQS